MFFQLSDVSTTFEWIEYFLLPLPTAALMTFYCLLCACILYVYFFSSVIIVELQRIRAVEVVCIELKKH